MQLANLQVGGMKVITDLGVATTVPVVSSRQRVASQVQAHSGHNYRTDSSEMCLSCDLPCSSNFLPSMESADTAALTSTLLEQHRPALSQSSYQEGPPSLGHFVLNGEATTSCVQEVRYCSRGL